MDKAVSGSKTLRQKDRGSGLLDVELEAWGRKEIKQHLGAPAVHSTKYQSFKRQSILNMIYHISSTIHFFNNLSGKHYYSFKNEEYEA